VDLGLGDGRSLGEEVEVASFIGLSRVPGEHRPVAAPIVWLRWLPHSAATFECGLVYQELESPVRDVEFDGVACSDERQRPAGV
jgi:hypothetical protein